MPYRNVNPTEAKALLDGSEGWRYVDVRTEAEFAQGHAAGASNIPIAVGTPPNLQVNPDFLAVVKANFKKDQKLVLGCASGIRSAKACEVLVNAGYASLVNMSGGFLGSRNMFGQSEKGWAALGFPTETGAPPDQSYDALRRKV